jgi:hypothetical protein
MNREREPTVSPFLLRTYDAEKSPIPSKIAVDSPAILTDTSQADFLAFATSLPIARAGGRGQVSNLSSDDRLETCPT